MGAEGRSFGGYLVTGGGASPKKRKLLLEAAQQLLKHPLVQPVAGSDLAVVSLRKVQTDPSGTNAQLTAPHGAVVSGL